MRRFMLRGGVPLIVAGLVAACAEQRFRLGFETDTAPPTVAVVNSAGDTLDIQQLGKIEFTVNATDNLGLKTITITLAGGSADTSFSIVYTSAVTSVTEVITLPQGVNSPVGGLINITATVTDGNANTSTATSAIFVINLRALTVVLLSPTVGSVTSPDKQIPVHVLAAQQAGIVRVGWQAIGVVNAIDSAFYALPDTVNLYDTLTVPTATPAGTFIIFGFAVDSAGRRVSSLPVTVTVLLVANDTIPPIVTFTVPQRAEARDSIIVRAKDPTGITLIGWKALDSLGNQISGQSTTFGGTLTDVSVMNNLNIPSTYVGLVVLKAWATDGSSPPNTDSARVDTLRTSPVLADSIIVVYGLTKGLPAGGRVVDAIYNPNAMGGAAPEGRLYLTNYLLNRLEVFNIADTSFKTAIPIGSRPWGIALWPADTLGTNLDRVLVANSGGTDISIVDVALGRETGRHALPNYVIQTVGFEIDPATSTLKLKVTDFDFSDRPQYLAAGCRPTTGSTACAADSIYTIYATTGTEAQPGDFAVRGTVRWENLTSATPQSHFFWEQAEKAPSPIVDTLQVIVDRGPTVALDTILSAACGRTVNLIEIGFADSTFTRNSGNFTHVLVGEGGTGVGAALDFARAINYNVTSGITSNTCTATLMGTTFTGREERDLGISPGIRVRDLLVNRSATVRSIGVNFNGLTNLVRADSVYVFDEALKLKGLIGAGGSNAGMDLNFDHTFRAGTAGTPTFGGTLDPNDRLMFAASEDPQIDVFDTYFWGKVASIAIRDPVIGPLRVAKLPSGVQILVGVTARGVVTVRLPAITNTYLSPRWAGGTP